MFNCPNTYAHINEWDELKVLFLLFGTACVLKWLIIKCDIL